MAAPPLARPALQLRLARPGDVLPIAVLSRDLIEHGLPWAWTPARVDRARRAADTNVLVAQSGAALVGFGIMRYRQWLAHLDLLAVVPAHRQRGLGRQLVEWLERVAREAGIRRVYVEARVRETGTRAFYGRLGFVEIARLHHYYCGREDAVRLGKILVTHAAPGGRWAYVAPGRADGPARA